ncbi:addiction module toxin RelE [Aliarcobacter cryaerophilus ATCC 43158]|uniref:Toxin-antitoxin system, toxin component, RelE/ParE family n=1 Tax=Aliarcobacter cryaerophilus ATCC 43158 TaxID=1032070 RepID=A0AAD0TWY3_9BACT|nr:type II toxin-antitoxin system RelE/ParE family toxin [Aliarcobacter cryaerophilus]AYJ79918.1 toxin-antitoxin system, toxin component, RelE/ParE family [Aliarcobacter cryaerophilus ATCC 43158]PRM96866.1 type II toxin-antitoxin system mRNA interferase toxin, RelE/StbE family [Aliarcobacter cryaerophilus]QCZ24150.1 addiction module toxin RelE [Aliarcobacter cryaerophilus ATCC 43158]
MIYKIKFTPISYKEWNSLDSAIKLQFKKKLEKIVHNPRIVKNKLSGYKNIYKIKLRSSGFRLACEVKEEQIVILVLSVGKRENNKVYEKLKESMTKETDKEEFKNFNKII